MKIGDISVGLSMCALGVVRQIGDVTEVYFFQLRGWKLFIRRWREMGDITWFV